MKERYLRPAIVNAGTFENNGVLPILEAIAAAAGAGHVLGRSLKKVFGATNIGEKFSALTKGRRI